MSTFFRRWGYGLTFCLGGLLASSGYAVEASADFRTAVPFGKMPPRTLSPIEGLVNLGAEPHTSVFAGKKVARAWYVRASVGAGLKAQMDFTRPTYGGLVYLEQRFTKLTVGGGGKKSRRIEENIAKQWSGATETHAPES